MARIPDIRKPANFRYNNWRRARGSCRRVCYAYLRHFLPRAGRLRALVGCPGFRGCFQGVLYDFLAGKRPVCPECQTREE